MVRSYQVSDVLPQISKTLRSVHLEGQGKREYYFEGSLVHGEIPLLRTLRLHNGDGKGWPLVFSCFPKTATHPLLGDTPSREVPSATWGACRDTCAFVF